MIRHLIAGLVALVCLAAAGVVPAAAQTGMALVIGNSTYQHLPARKTTDADARAIGEMLTSAGFAVTSASNLTLAGMRERVREFAAAVAAGGPDKVAFVYYAGHGLQVDGESFLVPVDARIEREADVPIATMRLTDLMGALSAVPASVRIVILDAARNNPFTAVQKSTGKGLAIVDALPADSIVAYATAPGQELAENDGPHSFYTTALLEVMKEPGLQIEQAFKKVRVRVNALSGGRQVPWETSSLARNFSLFPASAR